MSLTASTVAAREAAEPGPSARRWDAFVQAKTSDEFCRAWLALICGQVAAPRAAAVLVEGVAEQAFVPVAAWPDKTPEMGHLSGVVERALTEKRGILQPNISKGVRTTHVAYPVFVGERVAGVVVLDTAGTDEEVKAALRDIHWGSAWLANLLAKRDQDLAHTGHERIRTVLESTALALRHGKFQQALFEVANDLRQHFQASRVAIGLAEHAAVKLAALSEAATFEKHAPMVKAYTSAMEETHDEGRPVQVSNAAREGQAAIDPALYPRHRALLEATGDTDVLTYPLLQGARCVGVLLIEKSAEKGFDALDLAWLEAFAGLLTPIVEQRRAAERNAWTRLVHETQGVLHKFFGPRHLVWKAAGSLTVLVLAVLLLVHIDYRVTAKTVIEGEIQRVAAAPFDGFIGASHVRAGDTVRAGQVLAQLDDRDLKLEQVRWASERDQYDNKLREAMAKADMSGMQVIGAQLRQAQAQWALVTEKIERARLTAPYDGIVVSGDLSQQIGSPVETGKKLFEIAPLQSYRVILQVDEREIRHVKEGHEGHIVITGLAGDPMPMKVVKVTPVATTQDGKNFFRVEASLGEAASRLRPGMEGVGKIEVGSHQLWWILTHSFTDWLTLTLWTWMP
jgi:multidrug resistance efflux pump